MKTIKTHVTFTQSKTYPTDWKLRVEFKDGYETVLVHDEVSKDTKFGAKPDTKAMQALAKSRVQRIAQGFGFTPEIHFA